MQFVVLQRRQQDAASPRSRAATPSASCSSRWRDASLGVDFWWIRLKQQIGVLTDDTIFGDPAKYAALFHRAPDGSLSTDGSQCPGASELRLHSRH